MGVLKLNKSGRKAEIFLLISAFLWGGEYVVVKDAVAYLPPNWINAVRFLSASAILFVIFRKSIIKTSIQEIKAGIILGVFLFGGFALQTIGIQYTTASKSGFLTSVYVVIVPFAVWILKGKSPGVRAFISALVCIAGVAFISLENGFKFNPGDVLTLGAAVFYAGGIIGFDHYSKIYVPINLTFYEMFAAGIFSLIVFLGFESAPSIQWGAYEISQMLYIIVLGSLVCHLLSNVAMKYLEAARASILYSFESVFALVLSAIFLHERFSFQAVIGFILIFSSLLISESSDID